MTDRVAVASLIRVGRQPPEPAQDLVAVEAPLAIDLRSESTAAPRSLGVFMRTPGDDHDFVLGLLYAEGIIRTAEDVQSIARRPAASDALADTMDITLAPRVGLPPPWNARAVLTSSACGLCGRLALEGLDRRASGSAPSPPLRVTPDMISMMPSALRERQAAFAETGGLHAAGFFDATGRVLSVREDVGRHNAVDKLIGAALATGDLPARHLCLIVSGRVAFEIVQKAAMAGVPILVAVGAPSSLAIDAARASHVTLIGFARDGRFNVYAGQERIQT